MSPFKFTYKKELTLVQKFALQNAQENTPSEQGLLHASHVAQAHEASPNCPGHSWPAGDPAIVLETHTPTCHSEDAAVEWDSLPRWLTAHTASLAYPHTCLPALVHELRKGSCNGPEGEGRE